MKVLLDTHAWIWLSDSPDKVNMETRQLLATEQTAVYISAISVSELSIKQSLGKLRLSHPLEQWVSRAMSGPKFEPLPITFPHAIHLAKLPWHHRDPFDRLLIAQAQVEGIAIVTDDPRFSAYGVQVIGAS